MLISFVIFTSGKLPCIIATHRGATLKFEKCTNACVRELIVCMQPASLVVNYQLFWYGVLNKLLISANCCETN